MSGRHAAGTIKGTVMEAPARLTEGGATVVVIEPDARERERIGRELAGPSLHLEFFSNSRDARRHLQEHDCDLVVTEMLLGPWDDGIKFIKWANGRLPNVPVVISTAYPAYRGEFINFMAAAYTVKSDGLWELKHAVSRLLGRHR